MKHLSRLIPLLETTPGLDLRAMPEHSAFPLCRDRWSRIIWGRLACARSSRDD